MNKSFKKTFIIYLASLISIQTAALPVLSATGNVKPNQTIQLREAIDKASSSIKLEGGVSIAKTKNLITLSLVDSDVKQVLRMFADKAGLNIIFDKSVDGTVTLDLVNVTLDKAFEYVMTVNKLSYWVDGSTLVVASQEAAGELGMAQQQIMPIQIKYLDAGKVASFLNSNIFSLKKPNISSKPIVITNPRKNEVLIFGTNNDVELAKKVIANIDTKPDMKIYKVNNMTAGQMASLVCKNVFNTDGTDAGAPDGSGGGKLACEGKQDVSADNFKSLDTNSFSVTYYPDLGTMSLVGATNEQELMTEEYLKANDKPEPQAYMEISIIELSEAGSKELSSTWAYYNGGFGFDAGYGATSAGESWTGRTGTPLSRTIKRIITDPLTGKPTEQESTIPGGYFYRGGGPGKDELNNILGNNSGIYALDAYPAYYANTLAHSLSAILTAQKGRTLANPRIIATNNKTSTIDLTSDYLKSRTDTVQVTNGISTTTTSYETGSAGIKIDIKPTFSPDGTVKLDIKPEYSTVKEQIKNGSNIVLTFLNNRTLDLKGIRIKDGETLILGGLMQENQTKSASKIPMLGDIPIIGAAFRSNSSDKSKSELIIMITPKIIKDTKEENI